MKIKSIRGWSDAYGSTILPAVVGLGVIPSNAGNNDAILIKLDPLGQGIWQTFYGGSFSEYNPDIAFDTLENIYATGNTTSHILPQTSATNSWPKGDTLSGNSDFYLLKLNSNGNAIKWAHFIGGSSDEDLFPNLSYDSTHYNIYFAGTTFSIDFPYIPSIVLNAFNQSSNMGGGDAILVKMDTTGEIIWSTFFGGPKLDQVSDISTEPGSFPRIIISGSTFNTINASSNILNPHCLPITQSGDYFPDCDTGGGNYHQLPGNDSVPAIHAEDGMLVEFDKNGVLNWSTLFGGNGDDFISSIKVVKNNVYIAGHSANSPLHFPLLNVPGGYNQTQYGSGLETAFFAKFKFREFKYCSFFGSSVTQAWGIDADESENFFVIGRTNTPHSILSCSPPTTDSTFSVCNGNGFYFEQDTLNAATNDSWIVGINYFCELVWSTYVGGNGDERCLGIKVSPTSSPKVLYTVGSSSSGDYDPNNFAKSYPYVNSSPAYSQPLKASSTDAFISRYVISHGISSEEQKNINNKIMIYPNPTNEIVTIVFQNINENDLKITISDLLGRIVSEKRIKNNERQLNLNLNSFPNGIYLIQILDNEKLYVAKVVKNE